MCSKSSSKQVEKTVNKSVNNDVKKINFSITKNHYSAAQGAGGGSLENNKKNDLKPTKRQDVKEVIFQTVTNNKITYIPKDFKQEKSQQSVKDQKINSFLNDIKKYEENLETKATKTVSNIKQVVKNINPEKTLDRTQVVIDLIGLAPGYGEAADLTNACIYLIRNDKKNTMRSVGAAAPFIGASVTSTKLGLKAVDAINDANIVKKIINAGDETVSAGKLVDKGLKNNVIKGGLDGAQAMLKTPSANAWGTLADGTNQGIKHFNNYWELYPERIPSIANRLGVDPADFSNTVSGFENFTKTAQNIIDNPAQMRVVNGKSLYFVEGAEIVNKGVTVIVQDGKIQSMMPTALKDFLKLQ